MNIYKKNQDNVYEEKERARNLIGAGKFKEAVDLLKKHCSRNPMDSSNWTNLAACLKGLGRTIKSYKIIKEAIRINPEKIANYHPEPVPK